MLSQRFVLLGLHRWGCNALVQCVGVQCVGGAACWGAAWRGWSGLSVAPLCWALRTQGGGRVRRPVSTTLGR